MWRQPKPVWAVAFACVIAFMGIGLVDPILKSIGDELGASPSQVSLLFTSYMVVMGLAMLVTGAVSSRLGAKRTLLIGLATIVSAAKGSVGQAIVLYEAALGLGIAAGPLIGGVLGSISWRGPFFGVSALMLVALAATALVLPSTPPAARPTSLAEPFRALRDR